MDLKQLIKYSKEKEWREKNKDRFREYMKEYMRKYRTSKKPYIVKTTRKLESKVSYFIAKENKETTITFD
jgi:thermostable 8-oxoguanine DNA glycosylase